VRMGGGSCLMAAFDISGVEPSGSAPYTLVSLKALQTN
jgi:hypothetical protein